MEDAGAAGDRRGAGTAVCSSCPEHFTRRLPQLDGEHPRLEHLAPALVGPPHPGLVLPALRRDDRHRGGDARRLPALRRAGRAGSRRARHLVLLRALAVLDPGLAGRHRGPAPLLPVLGDGDRLRHPLLLGRPDGHVRARVHGRAALPHRLPARHGARRRRREDEQDQGQRDRSHRRSPPSTAPTPCASPSSRRAARGSICASTSRRSRTPATSPTSSGTRPASRCGRSARRRSSWPRTARARPERRARAGRPLDPQPPGRHRSRTPTA